MEKINFYTQSSLNQTPELRMVIDVSGNVGIGESNPTKSLEVVGDISFNGNLYQNGALFTGGSTIDETTDVSLNNLKVHGDLSANDASFNVVDSSSINITGTSYMQSIIPSTNNTYSLGDPSSVWKDIYIGPGSLYIDGQKVLESDANTIVVGADENQNLKLNTTGTGVTQIESANGIQINSTGSGNIELGSTGSGIVRITNNLALNGNVEIFNDSSDMVKINDSLLVTGDISFNGNLSQNGANINTIYATIASPTLTGTPLAPTASSGTNTTQLATTAFVSTAVSNLVNAAPGALDTLSELAAALDNSANFATNVTTTLGDLQTQINTKVTASSTDTFTNKTIDADGTGNSITNIDNANIKASAGIVYSKLSIADNDLTIAKTSGLQTALDEELCKIGTQEYAITVASKTTTNYYNGTGSSSAFFINGNEGPYLKFTPGKKYKFLQDDGTNSNHPLKFYLEVNKTTEYSTNVTLSGTAGQSGSYTEIEITDSTPTKLYYQCANHSYMGNVVYIDGYSNIADGDLTISKTSGLQAALDAKQATLTAGTNITITGTTISASGGGGGLTDLSATSISDLSDVSLNGIQTNQSLKWDGEKLIPYTLGTTATSVTKQGQVLETLAGVCDGRTVVVESGNYTLPNVTASYSPTAASWVDVTGSSIDYKPPAGTKQVIYNCTVKTGRIDNLELYTIRFKIDNIVVDKQIRNIGIGDPVYGDLWNWRFVIDIGTNDIGNGRVLSWTSLKNLKIEIYLYSDAYELNLHYNQYYENAVTVNHAFSRPSLEITAIGESSGQAVTLTSNSVNDLSDISFNSTSTTNGQALVWNSTDSVWEAGTVASSGGGGLTDLSASSISDLSDVSFNSLSTSQGSGLIWNNTDKLWEPGTLTASITNTSTTTTNTTGWNQQSTSGTVPATSAYSDIVVYNDSGTDYLIFSTGWTGSQSNKTYRYNISTSTWGELSTTNNVPVRYGSTAGIYNNNYYVFGGRSSSNLNDTWKLNLTTNAWSQLSTTGTSPVARRYPNSGVYNGKLIIFGGYGSTAYNDVWELNLSTLAWTRLHDGTGTAPPARYIHSVNITGDNLYTFGGINSGTTYNDTWKFNLTNNTWSQLSTTGTTPSSRRSSDSIIYNNNLYIFGGVNSSAYLNDVWELNLSTLAWKELHDGTGTAPAARVEFKVVLYNAKLYLFGGNDASILLSDTWEFTLPQYSTTYNPVEINKLSTKYALSIGPNYDTASLDNSGSLIVEGNVGIGISDPSGYKLEVAGDISFNGNLYQNGALFTGGSTIDETTDVSLNNLDIHGKLDISGYLQSTDSAVSTPYTSLNVTNSLFISITTALSRGNTTGITMNTLVYDNDTWIAYVHNSNYTKMIRIKAIYQNNTVYIGITESKFFSGSQTSDYIKTNWGSATTAVIYPTNSNGYGANVVISIFGAQQTAIDLNDVSTIQNTPNSSWDVFTNITSSQIYTENNSVDFTADVHIETFTYGTSNQSSDDRIKHNEEPITNALSILAKITPKHYFKTGSTLYDASHNFALNDQNHPLSESGSPLLFKKDYTIETGIIAQEIQSIPELKFAVQNTTPLGVDYNSIHCTHIAATKELHQLVQSQQTIIEEQQQEIEHLKLYNIESNNQINQLQQENQQLKHEIAIIKGHLGL